VARGWHITTDAGGLTLSRHLPPRFDVAASTRLPGGDLRRVAHQVRQDMWRALQNVRGFSPVVTVQADGADLHVRAGGRVAGCAPSTLSDRIADVLESPSNRARWVSCANRGSGARA